MPAGSGIPEPDGESVEGDQATARRRSPGLGGSDGCPARGRAVEQDRPGDHPAEDVDEHDVGNEDAEQKQHRAPVDGLVQVDVLAAPRAAADHREGATAMATARSEQQPTDQGYGLRTQRDRLRCCSRRAAASTSDHRADARRRRRPQLGPGLPGGCRESRRLHGGRSYQAQLLQRVATRWPARSGRWRTHLPVTKASVQPF